MNQEQHSLPIDSIAITEFSTRPEEGAGSQEQYSLPIDSIAITEFSTRPEEGAGSLANDTHAEPLHGTEQPTDPTLHTKREVVWGDFADDEEVIDSDMDHLWQADDDDEIPMTPEQAAMWQDDEEDVGGVALSGFGIEVDYNADQYPRDLYGDREGRGFAG